jgi:hypothetical protein
MFRQMYRLGSEIGCADVDVDVVVVDIFDIFGYARFRRSYISDKLSREITTYSSVYIE